MPYLLIYVFCFQLTSLGHTVNLDKEDSNNKEKRRDNEKNKVITIVIASILLTVLYFTTIVTKRDITMKEDLHLKSKIIACVEEFKKDHQANSLTMASLTDFDWDTLYVISPYSNVEIFIEANGLIAKEKINSSIEVNDGINLLLFVKNGEIISYVEHNRASGDFTYSNELKDRYSSQESIFQMTQVDGWIYFSTVS